MKKLLEELMALKRPCELRFRADNDAITTLRVKISDFYSREGVDYLKMENGLEIRQDRILEIDGQSFEANC